MTVSGPMPNRDMRLAAARSVHQFRTISVVPSRWKNTLNDSKERRRVCAVSGFRKVLSVSSKEIAAFAVPNAEVSATRTGKLRCTIGFGLRVPANSVSGAVSWFASTL